MALLPRAGESVARYTNRRKFLKKTAMSLFSLTTGMAVSLGITTKAFAAYCQVGNTDDNCYCAPPNGVYCSSCSGYNCGNGCTVDKGAWSNNGCWCSSPCYIGSNLTYYVCCDCWCGSTHCGCSQLYDYS